MTQEQLNEILEQHRLWHKTMCVEGKRADLTFADLRGVDLKYTNLVNAILIGANLTGADLRYANLRGACVVDANLSGADLSYSVLDYAFLEGVNLTCANLEGANLLGANLKGTNLTDTGIYLFKGSRHDAIYNSKDDKLYIGCQVQTLEHWLQNYVDIGRKYGYTDEQIEAYGNWIKSLKGLT